MCETIDAAHEVIMAAVARGEQECWRRKRLGAPTPLAFWRAKRGLTQKQPSQTAGVSHSYIADLEAGRRKGDAALLERLAQALRLRMEDLVAEEVLAEPASRPKKEMAP